MREQKRKAGEAVEERLGHRPFAGLKRLVPAAAEKPAPPVVRRPAAAPAEEEEDAVTLFRRAVQDAVPLDEAQRSRVAAPPPAEAGRPVIDADSEVLAELADLVSGRSSFDIADTDEFVEGAVVGLDPRLVRRLRAGEFAAHGHLDLHRMTSDEARAAVDRFLLDAYRGGRRCVLIVHGKGRNSKDQVPVLKTRLKVWLAHGQWSRLVLAFTSARPCDGGTGALYVLLRRDRGAKQTFRVTEGAKR